MRLAAFCVALAVLTFGLVAVGAPRDPTQEAALDEQVAAVAPALVSVLHEGNAAMDRGDAAEAARAYEAVHTQAPNVPSVTRRLGIAEARAGQFQNGIQHCREALAIDPAPENYAAVAATILLSSPVLPGNVAEAFTLAKRAAELAPNAEYAQATLCQAALAEGDMGVLDACSKRLLKVAPNSAETHVFRSVLATSRANYDEAAEELAAARAAGLQESTYTAMRERNEAQRPKANPVQQAVMWTVAGFIGTFFVLFVLGMMLSDATAEKASDKYPLRGARLVRLLYRVLLTVSSLFFYVAATIVGMALVLMAVWIVFVFYLTAQPSIPVQIAFGVVSLYVLFALVRASFARLPKEGGARVELAKEKQLRSVLDAVTKNLRQRPIDEVYIRSDASLEVIERGGIVGHLRRRSPRVLHIGAFALEGLSRRAFEALVADEIARFGDDGAGGGVALLERQALDRLCERMRARGVATISNPAWWIVDGFRRFFERISDGALDLQETLADDASASLYGSRALLEGLRHLVRREIEVEAQTKDMVRAAIEMGSSAPHAPNTKAFDDVWRDYAHREAIIAKMPEDGSVESGDDDEAPAWSLLSDREALERTMKAELRAAVDLELGVTREAPSP